MGWGTRLDKRGFLSSKSSKSSYRMSSRYNGRRAPRRNSRDSADFIINAAPSFGAAEVKLKSSSARFAQEKKLALAKNRRDHRLATRGMRLGTENRRRHTVSQRVKQQRWKEDRLFEAKSHELRRSNESIVLQRKVWICGVLLA